MLIEILKGSRRIEDYHEHMQAAAWQSVVDVQDEEIAFTDLLRIFRKIHGYRMHSFLFLLGFCVLFHPPSLSGACADLPIALP